MPLYWGDYLRDTGHLNATQHGFYLLLIGHYWTTGKPLPDDDSKLWRIARADSRDHWEEHRAVVAEFFKVADGVWQHARIDEELVLAVEKRAAAKERAEHAASKRWAKHKQSSKHAQSMPKAMLEECPPSPSPAVSVPNGTGGDTAAVIFREGLAWLVKQSGRSESECRSLLGKARKDVGDEALIAILGQAQRHGPIDAVEYLSKAVAQRKNGGSRKPWEKPPADALPTEEPWEARLNGWREKRFWMPQMWGPPPGEAGCRVPASLRSAA
jgi:uncharacterized protein YdaU (DUF1376 family)